MPQAYPAPRFSIIIPLYNSAAYLAETLDSVLKQTYPAAEILAIDDGSRDNSAEIAASYGAQVQVIRQPNGGVSAARNRAAGLVTGDWLAFLDADDVWEPEHLETIAQAIQAEPDADVVYCGRRFLVEQKGTSEFVLRDAPEIPPPARLHAVLMDRCPFTPSSFVVRASTFHAVGGFRGEFNCVEDWDLLLRLSHAGARFHFSPAVTVRYRLHAAAASNNPTLVLKKNIAIVKEHIAPRLPAVKRILHSNRVVSRVEAEAAILLRENGMPGYRRLMLRSISRHPLHEKRRYKVAMHMFLRRVLQR